MPPRRNLSSETVLAKRTQVLGARHTETLMTVTSLANDLYLQDRYQQAAETRATCGSRPGVNARPRPLVAANAWQVYGNAACHAGQTSEGLAALRRSEAEKEATSNGLPRRRWEMTQTSAPA